MRVLHINCFESGGAALASLQLHKELLKNGLDSNYLTFSRNEDIPKRVDVRVLKKNRVKQVMSKLFPHSLQSISPFYINFSDSLLSIEPIIDQFDVFHIHWAHGLFNFEELTLLKGKKVVVTLHDMTYFTGGCSQSYSCFNYLKDCANCPGVESKSDKAKVKRNFSWKKSIAAKCSNVSIVGVSKWITSMSENGSFFADYPHFTVYNSTNTSTYKFQKKVLNSDKIRVLFVSARFSYHNKGYSDVMKALDLLPDSDKKRIELVTVGEKDVDDSFESQQDFGVINDTAELAGVYASCDFLVLPTWAETQSLVACEALCCGLPVLAYNVGPLSEIIGTSGGFTVQKDIVSLSAGISKMIGNLGQYNREKISEENRDRFTSDNQVQKILKIYGE